MTPSPLHSSSSLRSSFPEDTSPDSIHWQAPAPIAYSIMEMLREPVFNSADEMYYLLEVCLRHVGWLWFMEYVHAPFHQAKLDRKLDRALFASFLDNQREPSVGTWAYLGSRISHGFRQHTWPVGVQPLTAFVYGDPRDTQSHLSRLLSSRNHFAHSSFDTQLRDVVELRTILWQLLAPMYPLFTQHPILFWDPESCVWRKANGHWSEDMGVDIADPVAYCPYMICTDGTWRSLHPWLQIERLHESNWMQRMYTHVNCNHPWVLRYFHLKKSSTLEKRQLFAPNPWLFQHLQHYEQEQQGSIDFQPVWSDHASTLPAREEVLPKLQRALMRRQKHQPHFVWLQGYPGSGKTAWIAQAPEVFKKFFAIIRYQIRPNHLTLSPITFLRYVLLQLHAHLPMKTLWPEALVPHNTFPEILAHCSWQELDSYFLHLLHTLKTHRKRLLLCVDQFHWAKHLYRDETIHLYDRISQWKGVAYQNLRILLTGRSGYAENMIYDEVVILPTRSVFSGDEFALWLSDLGIHPHDFPEPDDPSWDQEVQAFRRSILFVLSQSSQALSSWDIRDRLAEVLQQHPDLFSPPFLFTPQIEWNLRNMRSYLSIEYVANTEGMMIAHYRLFHASWQDWLRHRLWLKPPQI